MEQHVLFYAPFDQFLILYEKILRYLDRRIIEKYVNFNIVKLMIWKTKRKHKKRKYYAIFPCLKQGTLFCPIVASTRKVV